MAEALRPRWKLCKVLPVAGTAKSSYEYARSAQAKGEAEGRAAARKAVIEAFEASGGTYGYRRVCAQVNADAGDGAAIGEWTVRSIMEEENLVARAARKMNLPRFHLHFLTPRRRRLSGSSPRTPRG